MSQVSFTLKNQTDNKLCVCLYNGMYVCSFFFESVTWDEGEVGFEKVPGGKDYENRSVVCFHFYVPPQVSFIVRE